MGNAEREQEPRCWTIQSQAERRDRGQTEKSWLLFEGADTSLYDLMKKSKMMLGAGPTGYAERERARAPVLGFSEPNRAERSRPDGEKLAVV